MVTKEMLKAFKEAKSSQSLGDSRKSNERKKDGIAAAIAKGGYILSVKCYCGVPTSLNTVHRTDGPCFVYEPGINGLMKPVFVTGKQISESEYEAAPAYPMPEDPCPQCKPGSYCRTPNCGRLKKLDSGASDAHKAYVKMKGGCYTGDPKDQPDYGPYIHGYMDRDLVPTSSAERILSRLTMAIPLEDTLKATIDGESLIHYFKTLISNSSPSVGQVVK